jgi:hypothetical protein
MSTEEIPSVPVRPKEYKPGTGANRYSRFAEDALDVTRTAVLDTILRALNEHQQILVTGANGIGKSFTASVAGICGLYTNPNTVVPVTAGTGGTLEDNIWKPIKSLFRSSGLPGRVLENKRELRTEFDEEWYLKCVAPKYPDDLEGDHNENVLYIVEEADKPGITYDHIDSVRSTVTSESDRILVIANPPTDETNCVHRLIKSNEWHTINFASWESYDAKIDRGIIAGEKTGKLADVSKIRKDWNEYHSEEWPGLEKAIKWSDPYFGTSQNEVTVPDEPPNEEFRDDLHHLWYKRRAGIVPPQDAQTWRPFNVSDVKAAERRDKPSIPPSPDVVALDVARMGGDITVGTALYGNWAEIVYEQSGTNLRKQRLQIERLYEDWDDPPIIIDAVGEGSGMPDELDPNISGEVIRYNMQEEATQSDEYRWKWSESLQELGYWLRNGGTFDNAELDEELNVAARTVEFSEKALRKRGKVVEATSKQKIKDELGHSPDFLDSLCMAVHYREVGTRQNDKVSPVFGW